MTDQLSLINAYAQCPQCTGVGEFSAPNETQIVCGQCKALFDFSAEILDFVAGRQRTKLEEIDYDDFYRVDAQLLKQFGFLKDRTAPLFDRYFESVLEIGAGTGGLTVGMLNGSEFGRAVVTDISPAMLAQCRQKVRQFGIETPVLYATNNGENFHMRDESFDLIVAYFCVHHIFDYERFLASCHRALRPGGRAVFVEPSLRFMRALFACASPAIGRMARNSENWGDPNFNAVLGVHRNMYFTTKFVGDKSVVGGLEDKHAFGRYEFEASARKAGFNEVETIPYGVADNPLSALHVYGAQLGAVPEFLQRFAREVEIELPGPLMLLDPQEAAPSLAFVLEKSSVPPQDVAEDATFLDPLAYREPLVDLGAMDLRYDIKISLPDKNDDATFRIEGWVLALRHVKAIHFAASSVTIAVPVGSVSRPDVYAEFADKCHYAIGAALHSGFLYECPADEAPLKRGDRVSVSLELDNGQVYKIDLDMKIRDDTTAIHLV